MGGGKLAGVRVEASVDECLHMHCVSSCRKEGFYLKDQSTTGWPWSGGREI